MRQLHTESRAGWSLLVAAAAIAWAPACSGGGSGRPADPGGDGGRGADAATGASKTAAPPPSDPKCPQSLADRSVPPATSRMIFPRHAVAPFYQWESNNGYCGEVSLMQAGLNSGQWMSQLAARSVCGAAGNGLDAARGVPLSQSGPDGFCSAHQATPDYNAQLLLEDAASANAATCLANARLARRMFDAGAEEAGLTGYQSYMSWVKAETIAGNQVTIGVFIRLGDDEQYDHIVSVLAVGTNHDPTDASYYDDDVLYFDDHGAYSSSLRYPAIPPGAGKGEGCTPFVFGYAFGALAKSRKDAFLGPSWYSILIPGAADTKTHTGGNGVGFGPSVTAHNYGFSVTGPADTDGSTLPVTLRIVSTRTAGVANPADPVAGVDYENPFIGTSAEGFDCTNVPPAPMSMTLEVTIDGLQAGKSYNLYEYDFDSVSGTGGGAALAVPTSGFNRRASMASSVTRIVASGPSFATRVTRSSRGAVVFRAVPAEAP